MKFWLLNTVYNRVYCWRSILSAVENTITKLGITLDGADELHIFNSKITFDTYACSRNVHE